MKYIVFICVFLLKDNLARRVIKINNGRIVGGTEATSISSFPYQAFLKLRVGDKYYQCGGTIISPKAILTAAHCLEDVSRVFIRIGSLYPYSGGLEYQSSNFRSHPSFDPDTFDSDIAVVRLTKPMSLDGWNTSAISLPSPFQDIPTNTVLRISGWGLTSENGTKSEVLTSVDVPTITNEKCAKNESDVSPRMVCAGYVQGQKDACQGDSGGPAVDVKSGLLLGIISNGDGCARANTPGIYTRVASFRIWIFISTGV